MLVLSLGLSSCVSLMQQAMNFSDVKFEFGRISHARMLDINLMQLQSTKDLNMFQLSRVMRAVSRSNLPLDLGVDITTKNPLVNRVATTLVKMDWTLVLQGKDTIHGTLNDQVRIPAGEVTTIPLSFQVNLFEFFHDKNAQEILKIAESFAGGAESIPDGIGIKLTPTIDTPLGRVTYQERYIDLSKQNKRLY